MVVETWAEKMKKKDGLPFIQLDEILFVLAAVVVSLCFSQFLLVLVISTLAWYWLKIRYFERLIVRKKRDIYNVQLDHIEGVTLETALGRTASDRVPMDYDLEQLETMRKFLVDKFVVINLILLILLGLKS